MYEKNSSLSRRMTPSVYEWDSADLVLLYSIVISHVAVEICIKMI